MHEPINVEFARLEHGFGLPLPAYQTGVHTPPGWDLQAAVPEDQPMVLQPMERAACPCGLVDGVAAGL